MTLSFFGPGKFRVCKGEVLRGVREPVKLPIFARRYPYIWHADGDCCVTFADPGGGDPGMITAATCGALLPVILIPHTGKLRLAQIELVLQAPAGLVLQSA